MAIKKLPESTEKLMKLSIDNGDLQALKDVVDKFGFVDEQAMLRFALFALLKAEKNVLYVDEGEKKVVLTPSQQLIKQNDTDATQSE
ncbi:MAG: hypothetical protein ACOZAR_01555 [Patescibacteria group bacterium]